jgi:hypothetical protein
VRLLDLAKENGRLEEIYLLTKLVNLAVCNIRQDIPRPFLQKFSAFCQEIPRPFVKTFPALYKSLFLLT